MVWWTEPRGSPRWTTTPGPEKSRQHGQVAVATSSASVSRTAASREREPDATAIATQTWSADSLSEDRSTEAAA